MTARECDSGLRGAEDWEDRARVCGLDILVKEIADDGVCAKADSVRKQNC